MREVVVPASTAPLLPEVIAFVANLEDGLAPEFSSCDVIYTEVAWRRGYAEFERRARVQGSYDRYLSAVATMCETAGVVVLAVGKEALRRLPDPDSVRSSRIDSAGRVISDCLIACWGTDVEVPDGTGTSAVIRRLAEMYDVVGDPCCGYGNTGRLFAAANKGFVMADVDARCVEYIRAVSPTWFPDVHQPSPDTSTGGLADM